MKVLAIIPARGGSKGIPLKNIRKLAGKPLLNYTISAVKKSKLVDRIIVSTDNKAIAKIAMLAGAEVPFMRPKKFSGDKALTIDVVRHVIESLKAKYSYLADIIVVLQPTSPLRMSGIIDRSISLLKRSNATSVVSVTKVKYHPYASFWHHGKYLKPFVRNFETHSLRQKRPLLYAPTGSVYTFWHSTLVKYNSLYGPRIKPIIEDELSYDIDTCFDFFVCEMILKNWKRYQRRVT